MELWKVGPGVDPGHGGRESHPPRDEDQGDYHPGVFLRHPAQDGPKWPRTSSQETPHHATCGSRGGGTTLSHSA